VRHLSILFLLCLPMISGCAKMVQRWEAADRAERQQRQHEAERILSSLIAQCEGMGYARGSQSSVHCVNMLTNQRIVQQNAERDEQRRKALCQSNELAAWSGPTRTGSAFEAINNVNEARAACERGESYSPPPIPSVAPSTQPTQCSLSGRRFLNNNQVACRWSCGAKTFETVEGVNFGCQSSPY